MLAAARDVSLRTLAFFAAFTAATGVAARMGNAQVAAHQIGTQLWYLLALHGWQVYARRGGEVRRVTGPGTRVPSVRSP